MICYLGHRITTRSFAFFPLLINTLRFGCCLMAYRDQLSIDQSRATRQQNGYSTQRQAGGAH